MHMIPRAHQTLGNSQTDPAITAKNHMIASHSTHLLTLHLRILRETAAFGSDRHEEDGMAKMRKKADLSTKPCQTCGLPFTWRKKWARVWDDVRFCSDRCRAGKQGSAARNLKA
jgi:hypothetical protein